MDARSYGILKILRADLDHAGFESSVENFLGACLWLGNWKRYQLKILSLDYWFLSYVDYIP